MDSRRYSEACRRNRDPILAVLRDILPAEGRVLEVGSGTGQHAAYFGSQLSDLTWQPSNHHDELHDSIRAWCREAGAANVRDPATFDLFDDSAPDEVLDAEPDAIVCINTIHIAPWEATRRLFEHAADLLPRSAPVFLYGPFRYENRELEESNQRFDAFLRRRDPDSGIRCFEEVDAIATECGFSHEGDVAMPANNRSLWWRRL